MLMSLLSILLATYLIIFLAVYALAKASVQDKNLRWFFLLFGWITPILVPWALIRAAFEQPKGIPYRDELARIEMEIEAERKQVFGSKGLTHSFSEKWKAACLESLAKTAQKIAPSSHRFGGLIEPSHRSA